MSVTQKSFNWNGPITFGLTFSYFSTQHRDRLQFSLGIELLSFKSPDLLPSASHSIVNHIHFSNQLTLTVTLN